MKKLEEIYGLSKKEAVEGAIVEPSKEPNEKRNFTMELSARESWLLAQMFSILSQSAHYRTIECRKFG